MLGSNPSSTCEKKNQRTEKTMVGVNAYGSIVAEDCCTIYSGNSNINRCDLRIEKVHLGKKNLHEIIISNSVNFMLRL